MKNQETITVESRWLTTVSIIITALYFSYLFFNFNTLPNDFISFIRHGFVAILLFFGFWSSTIKVKINKNEIFVSTILSFYPMPAKNLFL